MIRPRPKPAAKAKVVPTEPPLFSELERRGIVILASQKPSRKKKKR